MDESKSAARFDGAVLLLPYAMRDRARSLGKSERAKCEEIRLRIGEPLAFTFPEGEKNFGGDPVTRRDIDYAFELMTGGSSYALSGKISEGFVTAKGGYRVGIAGVYGASGLMTITGLNIRISREIVGCAEPVYGGEPVSTLVISPPGGGKTTLLRDLIRLTAKSFRVSLADERGEIAAISDGRPTMDIGPMTDVIEGVPKAKAAVMMLRSLDPQVIAVDEITTPEDVAALTAASRCGVKLYATVHGESLSDLREKPLMRSLFSEGIFERAVEIRPHRQYAEIWL